ncbi:hypothetical protein EB796_013055 [Bugula neritina]|uniref:Uncharacterized protein n=1 Tax=Bugula neritina TaxID=10212 RepID=A0A7J7JQK3_BUGNE|nr:hypothetical protein EB796_013055 [Bugula neritina]
MLNIIDGTINVLLVTFCYKKQGVNHPLQKSIITNAEHPSQLANHEHESTGDKEPTPSPQPESGELAGEMFDGQPNEPEGKG